MKKFKKVVAFLLVVCMLATGNMSLFANAAESNSVSEIGTDMFYRVFHLDAARKYFSAAEIKELIDIAADGGYNQFELYLADNQGFRLALNDMTVTTTYGTYDLAPSLGAGYDHSPHYTDGKNMWLTQAEMDSIIAYANSKGIGIIPCINAPGHMGAILESFPQFWYTSTSVAGKTSHSALDVRNAEAYAFGQALIEKYATYFASKGVKYLNIGADEYGADLLEDGNGTNNGMDLLYNEGGYTYFVDFVNEAAQTIKELGMTPRAYNDCIYYNNSDVYNDQSIYFDTDIEICYWNGGWSWGNWFRRADATYLAGKGFKMINTNGDYYHVLGYDNQFETAQSVLGFDINDFHIFDAASNYKVNIDNPAGAMFCIWCDDARDVGGPNTGTTEWVIENSKDAIIAFGQNVLSQKAPATKTVDLEKGETYTEVFKGKPTIAYEAMDPTIAEQTTTVNEGDKEVGDVVEGTVTSGEYYLGNGSQYLVVKNGTGAMVSAAEAIPWTISIDSSGVATIEQNGYYLYSYWHETAGLQCVIRTEPMGDYAYKFDGSNRLYVTYDSLYLYWNAEGGWLAGSSAPSAYFRPYEVIDPTTTTITFDAKEAGTTYAYIGDVEYTINVTSNDEEPEIPELQEEVIDLKEGETVGITVDGNVVGNYDTEDTTIATVTTTYDAGVTKIVFEGQKEGTTYVTIGNVRYTINVAKAEVVDPEPDPEVDKVITMEVGESHTEQVDGDKTGDHPTKDTTIATVVATPGEVEITYSVGNLVTSTLTNGKYYLGNGSQYLVVKNGGPAMVGEEDVIPWTISIDSSGVATIEQGGYYLYSYYYDGAGLQCVISQTTPAVYAYKFVNNKLYVEYDSGLYLYWDARGWLAAVETPSSYIQPYEAVENKNTTATDLTFYGHKEGTTYVTIGDVTYQINVTKAKKVIEIEEGEYKDITVNGVITGTYPTDDTKIATATVVGPGEPIKVVGSEVTTAMISGEYYIGANDKYLIVNEEGMFEMVGADEAIPWDVTMVSGSTSQSAIIKQGKYYFSNESDGNGGYIIRPLTSEPTYETRFDSYNDLYIVSPDSGIWHFVRWVVNGNQQYVGAAAHSDDALIPEYFGPYSVETTASETTVLGFYGRSVGETYVTIGDVDYTIRVVKNNNLKTEEIELQVNQIYDEIKIPGDVSGVYLTDDTTIATVTTTLGNGETTKNVGALVTETITDGEYYLGNGTQYLIVQNGTWVMVDESKAIPWKVVTTASGVVLQQGDYYLSNYISTEDGMPYCQISTTGAALSFKFDTNYQNALCFNFTDANSTSTDLYAFWNTQGWVGAEAYGSSAYLRPYKVNTTTTTETTLSFYGRNIGTTNVIIGDTRYVINVVEEKEETINITIPLGGEVVYKQSANVEDVQLPEDDYVDIDLLYRRQDGYTWVANPQANQSYYIMGIEQHYLAIEDGKFITVEEPTEDQKWTVIPKVDGFSLKYGDYYLVNHWHDGKMTLEFLEEDTSAFAWQFDQNRGIYCTDKVETYRLAHNPITHKWELNNTTTRRIGFSEVEINEGAYATEITFVGKQVGYTTISLGKKTYNITVTEAEVPEMKEVSIEYWITNNRCVNTDDDETTNEFYGDDRYTVSYDNPAVATEEGMIIGDLVAQTAARLEQHTGNPQNEKLVFWKTSINADGYRQEVGLEGRTTSGTFFDRIRFWHGKWSVSGDGEAWRVLEETDQLVAYYIQETDVTQEVITYAMDWGLADATNVGGTGGYNAYDEAIGKDYSYVLLDFAVKYESGTRVPNEFPRVETIGFHCDHADVNVAKAVAQDVDGNWYRKLGVIQAQAIEGFEVYMVTLTPHTDVKTQMLSDLATDPTGVTYSYDGTEKVVWVDDEANLGAFTDPSLHAEGYHVGGTPYVPEITIYEHQAMLVTYYVRAVPLESALEVHYHDATGLSGNLDAAPEFYMYNISVEEGTVFPNGIENDNGELSGATVINFIGIPETVTSDLSAMPAIPVQYRYGEYEYVTFSLSDDRTQLHLYYVSDEPIYVVDFGLPVNVDLGLNENATAEILAQPTFGTAVIKDGILTYEPTKVLRTIDSIVVKITEAGNAEGAINTYRFYPATTVYYEESFITTSDDSNWKPNGAMLLGGQATEELDKKATNYGYDAHYGNQEVGPSNNTEIISEAINGYAEFTFTGTGVDLYANCSPDSGALNVIVYRENGSIAKLLVINTKMASDGSATQGQVVSAYNVPVASIDLGTHGTYRVRIRHVKTAEGNTPIEKPVSLDGFRVYNTLSDSSVYAKDGEANPTFNELRDMLFAGFGLESIKEAATAAGKEGGDYFTADELSNALNSQVLNMSQSSTAGAGETVILIDSKNEHDNAYVQDLLDNGPKNEIYLFTGQTLMFKPNAGVVAQLGLKALDQTVTYEIQVGTQEAEEITLTTSTDMFYTLGNNLMDGSAVITITNTGAGILSITDLKWMKSDSANVTEIAEPLMTLGLEDYETVFENMGFGDVDEGATGEEQIKYQTRNDKDLRLIGFVDDLSKYDSVVFTITVDGMTSKDLVCTYAYDGLYANGVLKTTNDIFQKDGHFVVFTINNYLTVYAGKEVEISATYTKADGTTETYRRTVTIQKAE